MTEKKLNTAILKELLKEAQERGCSVKEKDVLAPPSREEIEAAQEREIEKYRALGYTILDEDLRKELIAEAHSLRS